MFTLVDARDVQENINNEEEIEREKMQQSFLMCSIFNNFL